MANKGEMTGRKKGMIALTAGICVIAILLVVVATQTVLGTGESEQATHETERIKADTRTETDATTGSATNKETTGAPPSDDGNIDVENNSIISSEKAKMIALSDAGLDESQVVLSRVRYEWDDGVQRYDIEFYHGGAEYEYEIDAKTGKIIEKDIDD